MKMNLEDFANENRKDFDSEFPPQELWNKIETRIQPAGKKASIIQLTWVKWSVAAATIILISALAIYLLSKPIQKQVPTDFAKENNGQKTDSVLITEINPGYAQELFHFTKLIELKQEELRQLEKENPALYKEFVSDINSLDSSYTQLKNELPNNPNREQLLEAMISNLQSQMNLLNQQLQVIQQIKQAKNLNNESNSKKI
jgi:hypothetical protein